MRLGMTPLYKLAMSEENQTGQTGKWHQVIFGICSDVIKPQLEHCAKPSRDTSVRRRVPGKTKNSKAVVISCYLNNQYE